MFAPLRTAASRSPVVPVRATHARMPGNRERAGRLEDRPRLVEHVLDRGADLVVRDADDLVHRRLHDRERDLADLAHRDAVSEDPDAVERDPPARGHRLEHRVRFERLDADHAHRRAAAP